MNFIGHYLYGLKCLNAIKMISFAYQNTSKADPWHQLKYLKSLFGILELENKFACRECISTINRIKIHVKHVQIWITRFKQCTRHILLNGTTANRATLMPFTSTVSFSSSRFRCALNSLEFFSLAVCMFQTCLPFLVQN